MPIFKDQLGRNIELPHPPQKIISLVPSQTELLFDLGLDKEVIGITKFCIHPDEWFRNKTRVGGTKQLNLELIRNLQPDLIIANKEENTQSQLELLMEEFTVWVSDIKTLDYAYVMIEQIGLITNHEKESIEINSKIAEEFSKLKNISTATASYFIWHEPMMSVGNDTFINHLMQHCGFTNVFSDLKRYPEITQDDLRKTNPEFILLSSEPFPFKEKHIAHYKQICPEADILLVDGEMFSWYGSRLALAPAYFNSMNL